MMKGLVFDPGNNEIAISELEIPVLRTGEILIKVEVAGICGSDIVAWKGGFERIKKPVVLGHEATGTVAELGPGCTGRFRAGERVVVEPLDSCDLCDTCRKGYYNVCENLKVCGIDRDGCFAEYMSVREDRLHRISADLSSQRCAMCECVSVAIHVVRRSGLQYGDRILISGAGTIGVLAGMLALRSGAAEVVITDMNDYRLSLAEELGMKAVDIRKDNETGAIIKALGGRKADVSMEVVGVADSLNTCLEVTKSRGTVVIVGMFKSFPETMIQRAVLKELDLRGSRVYTYDDFEKAVRLLEEPDFPVEKLITCTVDFERMVEDGMRPIRDGAEILKALVHF